MVVKHLIITYTKLSLCLTFSLIQTRATSLDYHLLGIIDMGRNKVNKSAWRQRFQFNAATHLKALTPN